MRPLNDAKAPSACDTSIHTVIADIWRKHLAIEQIGYGDNFFSLGGHSLLAWLVVQEVAGAFAIELPLALAYEAPTIDELAEAVASIVRARLVEEDWPPLVRLADTARPRLSFAQLAMWRHFQEQPNAPSYNLTIVMRLAGPLDFARLQQGIDHIVVQNSALRTCCSISAGRPEQQIEPIAGVPITRAVVAGATTQIAERLAREDIVARARVPFDLCRAPLMKCVLYEIRSDIHILAITIHHFVIDGWGIECFVKQLTEHYRSLATARATPKPHDDRVYASWSEWLHALTEGPLGVRQKKYWARQLRDLNPAFPLSRIKNYGDHAKGDGRGSSRSVTLPRELLQAVRRLTTAEGLTAYVLVLAAWAVVLHHGSGLSDVVIVTPASIRDHPSVENAIGCFWNDVFVRLNVNSHSSFRTLLQQTRHVAADAFANRHVPFGEMDGALHVSDDFIDSARYEVNYLRAEPPSGWGALDVEMLDVDAGISWYDLSLEVIDRTTSFTARLRYKDSLFSESEADGLLKYWISILDKVARNPNEPIEGLGLQLMPQPAFS